MSRKSWLVPLFTCFQKHDLPFGLTLELHSCLPSPAAAALPHVQPDRTVYSLHYVLAGNGQLVRSGAVEQLQAGDAVLMHSGAAHCRAAAGSGSAPTKAIPAAESPDGPPWQLAELVAYMPQQLFEQQQPQQQQHHQHHQRSQSAAAAQAALQKSLALQPALQYTGQHAGHLPEAMVLALLAGARDTARQVLGGDSAAQQHQQPASGIPATDKSSSSSSSIRSSSSSSRASSCSSGPSPPSWARQLLPPLLHTALGSPSAWWQRQQARSCPVTRRTLAELTAFQLPNQTNRLAVQFDPFTRPQVPFISGIEVFERGHRTQPHVHPNAHELFFILAGEGTGFCGQDRFPVSAGDVVVFRPGAVHGIDNSQLSRMYCLELMIPNEEFAEFVRMGIDVGQLADDDMCVLASLGCR